MAIFDFLSNLLYGSEQPPSYQAPGAYNPTAPYMGQVPQYQTNPQDQQVGNQLQDTLGGMLARYRDGQPILNAGYRNAVLGQANRGLTDTANEATGAINEQFNSMNLLGGSGHLNNLQLIQRQKQRGMLDVEQNLTQQELGQLNNAISGTQGLQQAFAQRGQQQLGAQQFGYQAGAQQNRQQMEQNQFGYQMGQGQAQNQYQSQLNQYTDQLRKRQGTVGLLGSAAMAGYGGGGGGYGGFGGGNFSGGGTGGLW